MPLPNLKHKSVTCNILIYISLYYPYIEKNLFNYCLIINAALFLYIQVKMALIKLIFLAAIKKHYPKK